MNLKTKTINVEVAYGHSNQQSVIKLQLPASATLYDAIIASDILNLWPEIDLTQQKVGVLGKVTSLEIPLNDHDRVEIYRPLTIDPKDARRKRLKKKA